MRPWWARPAFLVFAVLLGLRLFIAALAPLSADEAYYRIWAQALAPGYLDHPPMVALWIRAGMALAGDTPLGIRLFGPVAALAGTLLLADAAERLRRGSGAAAAWLLNGTLLLNVGAVIMTPDTPLLLFWTLALWALARLCASDDAGWWLAVGAAAGLALDSKYTAALLAPALLLWLVLPAQRRWFGAWQLWAGAGLALALFAPVLGWNARHGWVSFAKQGGREAAFQPLHALRTLGELVAGQLGLATPLIFVVLVLGLWRLRGLWREPAAALLLCLTLVPGAVFVAHGLGDRVQANWPAPLYPGAILAACLAGAACWRVAALSGLALALPVYAQAAGAPLALPRRLDVTLIRLAGWSDLAGTAWAKAMSTGAGFVAADEYGLAAELAFHLRQNVAGVEQRWTLFNLPVADLAGRTGLLVHSDRRRGPLPWAQAVPVATAVRQRHGVVAESYTLYLVRGAPQQPSVWLPHGASGR